VRKNISTLLRRNQKYHINLYYSPVISSGANTRVSGLMDSSLSDNKMVFIRYEESDYKSHQANEVILKNKLNRNPVVRVLVVYLLQFFLRKNICVIDVFPMLPLRNHYFMVHDIGNYMPGVRRSQTFRACIFNAHLKFLKNILTVSVYTSKMLKNIGFLGDVVVSYNALDRRLQELMIKNNLKYRERGIDFLLVTSGAHHKRDIDILSFISRFYPHHKVSIAGRYNGFADNFLNTGNVTICNSPSDKELAALYRNSKVYISYSRHEGYGITVLEAIASGCNCVITKIPVFVELYKNYSCVYFLPIYNTSKIKTILDKALEYPSNDEVNFKSSISNWNKIYKKLNKDLEKYEIKD
jgi:glycosyltransferase involved in cell wall biosynthesis